MSNYSMHLYKVGTMYYSNNCTALRFVIFSDLLHRLLLRTQFWVLYKRKRIMFVYNTSVHSVWYVALFIKTSFRTCVALFDYYDRNVMQSYCSTNVT